MVGDEDGDGQLYVNREGPRTQACQGLRVTRAVDPLLVSTSALFDTWRTYCTVDLEICRRYYHYLKFWLLATSTRLITEGFTAGRVIATNIPDAEVGNWAKAIRRPSRLQSP